MEIASKKVTNPSKKVTNLVELNREELTRVSGGYVVLTQAAFRDFMKQVSQANRNAIR